MKTLLVAMGLLATCACSGAADPMSSSRDAIDLTEAGSDEGVAADAAPSATFVVCRVDSPGTSDLYVCGTGWDAYAAQWRAVGATLHTPDDVKPFVVTVDDPRTGQPMGRCLPGAPLPSAARCAAPLLASDGQGCTVSYRDGGALPPALNEGQGYCSAP